METDLPYVTNTTSFFFFFFNGNQGFDPVTLIIGDRPTRYFKESTGNEYLLIEKRRYR